MYKPVSNNVNFPKMEENILEFWKKNDIFNKSITQREGCEEYIFYDGPPFATGLPHFGNFLPGIIKDVIPRYQAMRGKKVYRRFGWDCHGLPVEYEMEKELDISGKKEIEEFGIARFNEACRSIVLRYTREWRTIISRIGRWVDFDNEYRTMDPDYMESIWWVVGQLWKKELLYEGFYILPYCPRCSTALSNFELNLGGYKEVQDPAITVRFKLSGEANTYILAWTTTPWTLPSNLALALGAEIDYVKVKDGEDFYILAKQLLSAFYKSDEDYEIVKEFKGSAFTGVSYEPLFPYFADLKKEGAFVTLTADFVSTEDGTGIVHIAPGFGEDDYAVLKDSGVPTVCPVDDECRFTAEITDYQGIFVKDADKQIIKDLKAQQKIVKYNTYLHNYPHCWRCSSPLIYRAISSWFVNIGKIKTKMLASNEKIAWMPAHLKHGRFGKWLENARDWAISRNRYWGNPIPIWRCGECKKTECLSSRDQLRERTGKKVEDLHKHFIDELTYACSCGGRMKRISDVLDCWFESGSMPYAQNHYPFENQAYFEKNFPADFISEGLDQTRGWFYTLTILATALFGEPAFKQVIVNGLVLDETGKKMSKSKRNFTDPVDVVNEFGADALRVFLMHSAAVKGEDLKFSNNGVKEVLKNIIIPIWNAYSFFVTYANIDNIEPENPPENPNNLLDCWILSEAERLVAEVGTQLDAYDIQRAIDPIVNFIDFLNNWYIRRSRRRFWRSENDLDKTQAYQTLHSVLLKLVYVASPFIPFITEEIYANIKYKDAPESVHLCNFPAVNEEKRDLFLEQKMAITRRAVSMSRSLRVMHNLKIRQPLKAIYFVTKNQDEKNVLIEMEEIVKEELNVKKVIFRENEEELVEYTAKPNYKVLGKQLGKDMKAAANKITALKSHEIQSLLENAILSIELGERSFELDSSGVLINRKEKENLVVLNEGSLTVGLDPELTEELIQEKQVRDLVRQIQIFRKEGGLEVSQNIKLDLYGSDSLHKAIKTNSEYLMAETLSNSWNWHKAPDAKVVQFEDEECFIAIEAV